MKASGVATKEERETIIRIGATSSFFEVWSDDKKFITKFEKAGYEPRRSTQGGGVEFKVPMKSISIRKKRSVENPKKRNPNPDFKGAGWRDRCGL